MTDPTPRLAIVTGASSGIGRELAEIVATRGFDLLVVASSEAIHGVASELRGRGGTVTAVQADLSTHVGVDEVVAAVAGRPVDVLCANAGVALGGAFLDQEVVDWRRVIDTNVTGTTRLVHAIGGSMRGRGHGRILVTGSIVGSIPGPFDAIYNASKAYLNNFTDALANELQGSGVTVTCLMPGATDTAVFGRAGMGDTVVGALKAKDSPAAVAKAGFAAMMAGQRDVVPGPHNKVLSALSNVLPQPVLASLHAAAARPGGARPER